MKILIVAIYKFWKTFEKILIRFRSLFLKKMFIQAGKNVRIGNHCKIDYKNIKLGNNVSIGDNALFMSDKAKIIIGNNVMFAPKVTIVTGNHRYNLVGRTMFSIKSNEKETLNDQNVIIKDDVWIGTGVIILKGVTIEKGSVIGAGSVVTKSTCQYGIYAGNPSKIIAERFDKKNLIDHLSIVRE